MALTSIGGLLALPSTHHLAGSTDYITLDSGAEKISLVFTSPITGTLIGCRWRTALVTTNKAVRVGIQSVNSSGDADAFLGATASAYATRASIATNTLYTETFGETADLTKGTRYAITIKQDNESDPATTRVLCMVGSGVQTAVYGSVGFGANEYIDNYVSSWTKTQNRYGPAVTLIWSGSVIQEMPNLAPTYPLSAAVGNGTFSTSSNPDEYGNKIVIPFACRAAGIAAMAPAASGAFDVVLYDSSNNVLASVSYGASSMITTDAHTLRTIFATPVELAASATVRAVIKPTSTTNVAGFKYTEVVDAADMAQLPMGTNCVATYRVDAGTWTNSTTQRAVLSLLIDQIDTGSTSSGGGSYGY